MLLYESKTERKNQMLFFYGFLNHLTLIVGSKEFVCMIMRLKKAWTILCL